MRALSGVSKIAGVTVCVAGDVTGTVVEQSTDTPQSRNLIGAMAFAGNALNKIGSLLGIGAPRVLSVKCVNACWVVAFQSGHVLLAKCDTGRTATSVEAVLTDTNWAASLAEANNESNESETLPKIAQGPKTLGTPPEATLAANVPRNVTPPRLAVPRPSRPVASTSADDGAEETPLAPSRQADKHTGLGQLSSQADKDKPAKGSTGATAAKTLPTRLPNPTSTGAQRTAPGPASDIASRATKPTLLAELRRALVKGQLAQADSISTNLTEQAKLSGKLADGPPIPPQLLEGIASVLAGDALGGLEILKAVESSTREVPAYRWVALIWCVRASASTGAGLEVAYGYAKSSLTVAGNLDSEARSMSTIELAEIEFQQGELDRAYAHTRAARAQLVNTSAQYLLANTWLLEARILAASGKQRESLDAAAQATKQRPSWPAPATLLARWALRDERINDADSVLQPLLGASPLASEVERISGVIKHVRSGTLPARVAYELLELIEARPTEKNVEQLNVLLDAYPAIEHLRDAYGWQLLRAGRYEAAKSLFEDMCSRADLTEEMRASALLALGCLATAKARYTNPEVKTRAVVDATPKNFSLATPAPRSSTKPTAVAPLEFRPSDIPPAQSQHNGFIGDEPGTSPKIGLGTAMFSGNLQLFGIPDLLEFLRSGKRTGTLLCSSTAGIGAVQLRKGRITGAASPKTKAMQDYLLAMGAITAEAHHTAADAQRDGKAQVGRLLIEAGFTTTAQVQAALRTQIRDAIRDLMSWGAGKFAFDPEALFDQSRSDIEVEVDPQETLLDIFREQDEGTLVEL